MSYATQEEVEYMASIGWNQACWSPNTFVHGSCMHTIRRRKEWWDAIGRHKTPAEAVARIAVQLRYEASEFERRMLHYLGVAGQIEAALGADE
jgi:hypothetical protein